jgi:hypothetical protein
VVKPAPLETPLTTQPRVARFSRSGRAAWAIPAAFAAFVTGYLAWGAWVSAHHPSWLYLDQSWWRQLLRPGNDGALVAVVILWLLTALSYWWPRRREPESAGLVIVVSMVVIGAVLGTASFAPCRGGQSRSAVAAWVLQLYAGQLEPRYGLHVCPAHRLPLALQLARTVCLGATLVGFLAAAAILWRQPVGRIRARLVKDATILTGLDAMTIPLLRHLTSIGPENRVVVIEPDGRHPLLAEVRSTGAQIVVADPASARVLTPMLRGWRGPQLRYLFALRPEAAENEAVLAAAKHVLGNSRADPDRPPHLIARIDDPRHADLWRGERIGESYLWFEDALSPQESTACALVHQIVHAGARQVLLCGDSTLTLAILLELARRAWEQQGLVEAAESGNARPDPAAAEPAVNEPGAAEPLEALRPAETSYQVERVLLLDRRAEDLRREYAATSPGRIAAALPAVGVHADAWRDHLLFCLDFMTPAEAAETAVVIADAPAEANMHEAGRAARLHPGTPVFVLSSDGAGITDAVFDLLQPYQRALLVDGGAPEDSWTRIARHWHECYRLAHPAVPGGGRELTRRPWAELEEFIREDNILQLRSIMAAVVARGRRWVPVRAVIPGSFIELTDHDVEAVARQEHSRWYERRRAAGWRAAAGGEKDDDNALVNSIVRPWPDLPSERREELLEYLQSQLAQLEAVGFMPVLPDCGPADASDFLGIGEIRAERLTGKYSWTDPAGDVLSGAPGDWRVVDEHGDERTVRDLQFRATHESLGGDRWRRVGAVRAWRVRETIVLRTLEGRAVAESGNWIVQGPRGVRWPVTEEQFARGYRAIQDTLA